jgi:hypothetical protein
LGFDNKSNLFKDKSFIFFMKYWLKGGVFGIITPCVAFVIFAIIGMIIGSAPPGGQNEGFIRGFVGPTFIFLWDILDFLAILFCKGFCIGEESMIKLFTTLPSFFIIGAIIGWIVGKIKSKE